MKLPRVCALVLALFALTALTAHASILGSADAFGILGASAVTNTGPSVVFQDLGVWPGTSITGFPPGIVHGTIHNDDAVAMNAQADALTGYNDLAGMARTGTLTGQDLGGLTLDPGAVYPRPSTCWIPAVPWAPHSWPTCGISAAPRPRASRPPIPAATGRPSPIDGESGSPN